LEVDDVLRKIVDEHNRHSTFEKSFWTTLKYRQTRLRFAFTIGLDVIDEAIVEIAPIGWLVTDVGDITLELMIDGDEDDDDDEKDGDEDETEEFVFEDVKWGSVVSVLDMIEKLRRNVCMKIYLKIKTQNFPRLS